MGSDAIVVGAGPNGLAAAITLAEAGLAVEVREGSPTIGGGTRSAELTLPGYRHDVCSAVHPLAAASPFFRRLPLGDHGLEFVHPSAPLAHPFDDAPAVLMERALGPTSEELGADGDAYIRAVGRLVQSWPTLEASLLGPLVHVPRSPLALMRFGLTGMIPSTRFARRFERPETRAMVAGVAAHSVVPLERAATTAYALVLLTLLHTVGWPVTRGGSQAIADALASYLKQVGGEIRVGEPVTSLAELSRARIVMLDIGPRQLVELAGDRLSASYRRALAGFRYGPGVFKLDYALDGPVPWNDERCARAGTVHLGGSLEEIATSERASWHGKHPEQPFVLLSQPTLFDSSRAPAGMHTAWAYCHVPAASSFDMTDRIEAQIERFAAGFRDRIVARSVRTPVDLEHDNPNLVGGDVSGGAGTLGQLIARPTLRTRPYRTPIDGVYLCSASTPPGGGVHGMCGHLAARAALHDAARRA